MRSNLVLLLSLALFSVIAGPRTGRAQSPDFQSLFHVFPQFVDGAVSEERSYTSTLQISATDFSFPTRCSLALLSMPPTTLADARGRKETSTFFNFVLTANGWQILQSQAMGDLNSGSAVVQCDRPVTAHLTYTLNLAGAVSSEATVSAAPPGRLVQILADQRRNSRLGLAIMNPYSITALYRISIVDIEGRLLTSRQIQIAANRSFTRFLDEFATLPRDYRGPVLIETLSGTDFYAAALRFNQDSFTAIPAMVRLR